MPSLTRIVPWSQQLACEVLQPGDLAVDLTAGKGRDTLALAKEVSPSGQVVAFDLQAEAIDHSQALLEKEGYQVTRLAAGQTPPGSPGIYLCLSCHSSLKDVVQKPVKAVIANLGYLPGGDQGLVTKPETTLAALQQSLDLLELHGRLAVVVYPHHEGGRQEANAVDALFASLAPEKWQVLSMCAANRADAPYLLVAEKRL